MSLNLASAASWPTAPNPCCIWASVALPADLLGEALADVHALALRCRCSLGCLDLLLDQGLRLLRVQRVGDQVAYPVPPFEVVQGFGRALLMASEAASTRAFTSVGLTSISSHLLKSFGLSS